MAVLKAGAAAQPATRRVPREPLGLWGQAALDACLRWLQPMQVTARELDAIDRRMHRIRQKFHDVELLTQFPDEDDEFWDEGRRRLRAAKSTQRELLERLVTQSGEANAGLRTIEIGSWQWLQIQVPLDLAGDPVWRWVGMASAIRELSPWREWLLMHSDKHGEEAPF